MIEQWVQVHKAATKLKDEDDIKSSYKPTHIK